MIIYGASGHAKVIIDLIESTGKDSIDFIIDDNPEIKEILGYKVVQKFCKEMNGQKALIAIGNNKIRYHLAQNIQLDFSCPPVIHPVTSVSARSQIGEGTVIMSGAMVNPDTKIGRHCIINTSAVIEHDVTVEDFAHISPSATITGNVKIGKGSHIGAGATIIPGVKIGNWVTIGAGAVVINDIPDYSVVVGNPAKIIKYNRITNGEK